MSEPKQSYLFSPWVLDFIERQDAWLDDGVSQEYVEQPLGLDWARIAKIGEEQGEAVAAFISTTGQNRRKTEVGDLDQVLVELADVVLTAILAIQHFTKDSKQTSTILLDRFSAIEQRTLEQIAREQS